MLWLYHYLNFLHNILQTILSRFIDFVASLTSIIAETTVLFEMKNWNTEHLLWSYLVFIGYWG